MIYLSAQPAQFYFVWQIQIQLYNFKKLGIKKKNIHVLFGYNPFHEIDERVLSFVKNSNSLANFYFYEDRRPPSSYEPTIRPHIIKQHIDYFPELVNEYIFYHDCDIIFRELPDFDSLTTSDVWYLSDTNEYIGAEGIVELSSLAFDEMLKIVGVSKQGVLQQKYTGGAQSLLKGTTFSFWDKVERDSNNIFNYLTENISNIFEKYREDVNTNDISSVLALLQPWCADMWAILWNGILFGFEIRTDKELDFSWATQNIEKWNSTKILHNAGVQFSDSEKMFFKGSFRNKSPLNQDFHNLDPNFCSIKYIEEMQAAAKFYRKKLTDVAFLIIVRIDSEERKENLISITKFINTHFETNIFVLEADITQKVLTSEIPDVDYEFIYDENPVFNRSKHNNYLLNKCSSKVAVIQDTDMIVNVEQILSAVNLIIKENYQMVSPYDSIVNIDSSEVKKSFLKNSDISILKFNHKKSMINYYALGGMVFLNRDWFVRNGGENKLIEGYGPDDIERVIRTIILGGKFKKVQGNIYHLSHPRKENSYYSKNSFDDRYFPLIKILSMKRIVLSKYIAEKLLL